MHRLRIATGAREIEALRPLWQSLERDPAASVFQSYHWNLAAARHLGERDRPYVVAVESDSGAAIVPAAVANGGVTFLGEMLFDYRDVLAAGDRAALEALIQRVPALVEVVPELRELDLNPVKVLPPGQGAVVVDGRVRLAPPAR